jgi:4-amino-4-deoxy-L-arabinose transferase-like glycosyltransferase
MLLIARFLLVLGVMRDPARGITIDSEQYIELAQNLKRDGVYGSRSSPQLDLFRSPGYPALLAMILAISGDSLVSVIVVQHLMGILCVILLYKIGTELGNERAGALAAFLYLLSPNTLFWSAQIMTEISFTLGLVLVFFLIVKVLRGALPAWVPGVIMGLMTLIRPIGLYLGLMWALWLFIGVLGRKRWKKALSTASLFLISFLLFILPWQLRNSALHGTFTLSTVSSVTFRSFHLALPLADAENLSWEEAKVKIASYPNTAAAAREILFQHPGSFAKAQLRGIARTILGTDVWTWMYLASKANYESSGLLEAILQRDLSALKSSIDRIRDLRDFPSLGLLIWGISYSVLLFVLGLVGAIKGWRESDSQRRSLILLALLTLAYLLLSPGAAGEARFRVPAEPFLALLGGMSLLERRRSANSSNLAEDRRSNADSVVIEESQEGPGTNS